MSAEITLLGPNVNNLPAWLAQLEQKLGDREVDYLFVVVQFKDESTAIHTFNASTRDATMAAASLADYAASRRNSFEIVE